AGTVPSVTLKPAGCSLPATVHANRRATTGSLTSATREPTPTPRSRSPMDPRTPAPTTMGYERAPRLTVISITVPRVHHPCQCEAVRGEPKASRAEESENDRREQRNPGSRAEASRAEESRTRLHDLRHGWAGPREVSRDSVDGRVAEVSAPTR